MIDRDVIAFLDGRRVAVSIASRSEHCIPSVTRALGYRISADRSEFAIFVPRQAERVLADLRTTAQAAVVFTEPSTHRSVQVKGNDARITPLEEGDWPVISAYADDLVTEICPLGYPEPLIRKMGEMHAAAGGRRALRADGRLRPDAGAARGRRAERGQAVSGRRDRSPCEAAHAAPKR